MRGDKFSKPEVGTTEHGEKSPVTPPPTPQPEQQEQNE